MTDDDADHSDISLDPKTLETGESGDLAHILAEEFRREKLTNGERKRLRDALVADQVGQLQRKLGDLEAYVDALEPILPDGADPNPQLQTVADRVADVESTLDEVERELEDLEVERSAIEESIDGAQDDLAEIDDRQADLTAALDRLESALDELESTIEELDELDDRTAALEEELERASNQCADLKAFNEEVSDALDSIGQ